MTVTDYLRTADLDSIDARVILQHFCSLTPAEIITKSNMEIPETLVGKLLECSKQRKNGIPVAYIIGQKDFYKSTFTTPEGVLIPRPDTETLVEEALKTINSCISGDKINILDLCAGSGCAGVSVAGEVTGKFSQIRLQLSDLSEIAFDCFSSNASRILGGKNVELVFTCGNLFEPVTLSDYNLIITNPPYIASKVIPTLSAEVRHEPVLALDGGDDGMDLIRQIVCQAPSYLADGGWLLMEIGYDQGNAVAELFEKSGFRDVSVVKDLGGNDRVVKGRI